jgi:dTDP-4-dehydrorhamnose reductase
MKKILIVGASGLIGGASFKTFTQSSDYSVVGTYFGFKVEGLIHFDTLSTLKNQLIQLEGFQPDYILHTGALTHVDYCETNQEESYHSTVVSTKNILDLATELGSKVIYLSTDYVFDGQKGMYKEEDEVNPLSIYGKHKLEAEQLVLKWSTNNLVLRVTNVYGDEIRGKNFIARLIKQSIDKDDLTLNLPYDQYATPVNAADVSKAIVSLIEDSKSGIYNISSTDYLNRVQLAQKVLSCYPSQNIKINSKSTKDLNQVALRPLLGGLLNQKFCKDYPQFVFSSVDNYLNSCLRAQKSTIY